MLWLTPILEHTMLSKGGENMSSIQDALLSAGLRGSETCPRCGRQNISIRSHRCPDDFGKITKPKWMLKAEAKFGK